MAKITIGQIVEELDQDRKAVIKNFLKPLKNKMTKVVVVFDKQNNKDLYKFY